MPLFNRNKLAKNIDKFLSKIGNNFPYVLTEDRSTYRLTFSNIELAHFLNQLCSEWSSLHRLSSLQVAQTITCLLRLAGDLEFESRNPDLESGSLPLSLVPYMKEATLRKSCQP